MNDRNTPSAIAEQAAYWHAAQDADDLDWDGFTAWLEADPRHGAALDALAIIDDAVVERREEIAALLSYEPAPRVPHRRGWGLAVGGAIAAALAIAIGVPRTAPDRSWSTAAAARSIALPEGVRATLAPHSRLTVTRGDATQLALVGGAYFDVAHRPARALTITAGDLVVRDVGTRFDIATAATGTRVAVAEGQVSVASPRLVRAVALTAGHTLAAAGDTVTLGHAAPGDVASWRRGQLVYGGTPLALVAAEIARYAGRPVSVDPRIADRRFSGVLTIGDGARLGKDVAALAGIVVRDDAAGLHLEPRGR